MLIAQEAAAAGDDVVVQLPGRMVIAQPEQRGDEVEGGGQGVGVILAQDAASCAVWGMPRAVLEAGLACAVMAPDKLARRIASLTGGDAPCK